MSPTCSRAASAALSDAALYSCPSFPPTPSKSHLPLFPVLVYLERDKQPVPHPSQGGPGRLGGALLLFRASPPHARPPHCWQPAARPPPSYLAPLPWLSPAPAAGPSHSPPVPASPCAWDSTARPAVGFSLPRFGPRRPPAPFFSSLGFPLASALAHPPAFPPWPTAGPPAGPPCRSREVGSALFEFAVPSTLGGAPQPERLLEYQAAPPDPQSSPPLQAPALSVWGGLMFFPAKLAANRNPAHREPPFTSDAPAATSPAPLPTSSPGKARPHPHASPTTLPPMGSMLLPSPPGESGQPLAFRHILCPPPPNKHDHGTTVLHDPPRHKDNLVPFPHTHLWAPQFFSPPRRLVPCA